MTKDPYALSDKAAKRLREKAVKRFRKTQRTIAIAGFDELNVISGFKDLYRELDKDNKKAFLDTARKVYDEAWLLIWELQREQGLTVSKKKYKPGEDVLEMAWLMKLLESNNEITKYIYEHEKDRKREYTVESVNAVKNKADKRQQIEKGMHYWDRMSVQYLDIVTDESMMQAYKDAGIEYVQWKTEQDERVCPVCEKRHDKIYRIDLAPPKAHWRCRCWYVPVMGRKS